MRKLIDGILILELVLAPIYLYKIIKSIFESDYFTTGIFVILTIIGIIVFILLFLIKDIFDEPSDSKATNENDFKKEKIISTEIINIAPENKKYIKYVKKFIIDDNILYELSYTYDDVFIAGFKYRDTKIDIKLGDEIIFVQKPNNVYDNEAVEIVKNHRTVDYHIGFISRDSELKNMANDYINNGYLVSGYINQLEPATMFMCFYKSNKISDILETVNKLHPVFHLSFTIKDVEITDIEIGSEVVLISLYNENKELYEYDLWLDNVLLKKASQSMNEMLSNVVCPIGYITETSIISSGTKIKIAILEQMAKI